MASTIRIKRSGTSGDPTSLGQGELAYSYLTGTEGNGGDRLYIGTGTEIAGNAVNHEVIGGKYFTDMLDHTKGVVAPNSALLVDGDKKLNELLVDNFTLDGNTISVGDNSLIFSTQGNEIDMGGVIVTGVSTPTGDSDAANKAYVDSLAASYSFDIAADEGTTDTFTPQGATLTFSGSTGLTSIVSNDQITFELDSTTVNAGSYGSQTAIPTFTVDEQGRLTAASTVNVATNLTVNGDDISLLDSDLTFTATGNGFSVSYTASTNTVDYSIDDATTSTKGVASFNDDDFTVTSGDVTLDDDVSKSFGTDSGAGTVTPSSHNVNILGNAVQGLDVTGSGAQINITPRTANYNQLGVAKFNSDDFQLNVGDVSIDSDFIRTINTDSDAVVVSGHTIAIIGGEGTDVYGSGGNIVVEGELASTTNIGVASFDSDHFVVTSGDVTLKSGSVENTDLVNDSIVIGDTEVELGATITNLTGLSGATVDDIVIDGNKISTKTTQDTLVLDPQGGDSNGGTVLILGDLTVQGTQTIINSTTMSVNDLNIVLADSAADAASANGAGITVNGASATITYSAAGDKWNVNKDFDISSGSGLENMFIGGTTLREHIEDHLANNFFTVGEGLDITYGSAQDSDNVILFSAELATYENKGVASFDSDQFTLTSGFVTLAELDGGTY